jgi:3-phosphoshikimate 1-carboxyvinyltransferase
MRPFFVHGSSGLKGEIALPGDKSIAHRSIIVSSLSPGQTVIENFPANKDCLSTLNAFKKLGLKIEFRDSTRVCVIGRGLHGLSRAKGPISVGESGTTFRLLLGVLAGQNFETKLIAGKFLSKRPMLRVNAPLRIMGAKIISGRTTNQEEYPPITVGGGQLKGITYKMPVASAQVKSAILLAGLYARGVTQVIEPIQTRDHTERMLKLFKAGIQIKPNNIVITGNRELISPGRIYIPGDMSSASFFIVGATILPDSWLLIKKVNLNPSRIGIINVLRRMGANIQLSAISYQLSAGEPMGDIVIRSSKLKGTVVKKSEVPSLIDELPVLMVAACFARGETIFEGVGELRVKETDRIKSMCENLTRMGAKISVGRDTNSESIIIEEKKRLKGAKVKSFSDHRTAMSMIIAGLAAAGKTQIDDASCISKSFPDFLKILRLLT